MTSSRSKIIRGVDIDGVVFCTPSGDLDSGDPVERQEKDNLKALEEFWRRKGFQEGKKEGFEEGWTEGEKEGRRRAFPEGENKGREEGLNDGHQKGLKEGEEKVRAELRDAISLLEECVTKLQEQQGVLYEDAKPELVRFALIVCEKILRRELEKPDALVGIVETIFQQARPIMKGVAVDVMLSEADFSMLQEALQAGGFESGEAAKMNFVIDESLLQGDIRVETPLGLMNFDIKRFLVDFEKKALEVRSEEGNILESEEEEALDA